MRLLYPLLGLVGIEEAVRYKNAQNRPPTRPPDTVSIIMPTLNEGAYIREALDSLRNQTVIRAYPDMFELVIVDSHSIDGTTDIAYEYTDKVLSVQRGKLNARTIGVDSAEGEIIVATDADTIYPRHWLNNLLYEFNDPSVVAVSSPRLFREHPVTNFFERINRGINKIMHGSNSAHTHSAFYAVGGFDLGIDQFDSRQLQPEEEIHFMRRLKKIGKFAYSWSPVFSSFRRHRCHACAAPECPDYAYCREVGGGVRFGQCKRNI